MRAVGWLGLVTCMTLGLGCVKKHNTNDLPAYVRVSMRSADGWLQQLVAARMKFAVSRNKNWATDTAAAKGYSITATVKMLKKTKSGAVTCKVGLWAKTYPARTPLAHCVGGAKIKRAAVKDVQSAKKKCVVTVVDALMRQCLTPIEKAARKRSGASPSNCRRSRPMPSTR